MQAIWLVAIALLFGVGLVKLLPLVLTVGVMRQTRFCCLRMRSVEQSAVPVEQWTLFSRHIDELKFYDFSPVGCWQLEVIPEQPRWGVLLQHPSRETYVLLDYDVTNHITGPLSIHFSTFLQNGCLLETVNGKSFDIYSAQPTHITQWVGPVPLVQQLNHHYARLQGLADTTTPQPLSSKDFITAQLNHSHDYCQYLATCREIIWVNPDDTYRMSLGTTIRATFKIARNMPQQPQLAPDLGANTPTLPQEQQVDLDVAAFLQSRQTKPFKPSRRLRTLILFGSLGLFFVASSAMFDGLFDWRGLLAFVGAIAFHEGGHALAMKAFGYRDTTVLFIPFFGALATARKDNASLTEKVWISLAGPLPGLILGIALAVATSQGWLPSVSWLEQAIWFLILLNLFNLIPIYPLDGGQVADNLLFSRNPYTGLIFQGIGVIVLLLLGIGMSQILLLIFALLVGATIPNGFRTARLHQKLRQSLQQQLSVENPQQRPNNPPSSSTSASGDTSKLADSEPVVQAPEQTEESLWIRQIFVLLQSPLYDRLPVVQKHALAQGVLMTRQQQSAPWSSRVGLSVIYLISLLLGIVGSIYALVISWDTLVNMASNNFPTQQGAIADYDDQTYFDNLNRDMEEYGQYYGDEKDGPMAEMPYICPHSPSLEATHSSNSGDENTIAGSESGDVMRDRQMILIASFPSQAKTVEFQQTIDPNLTPTDGMVVYGQSLLISTFSANTQSVVETIVNDLGGTLLIDDSFSEQWTTVSMTAEAPNEAIAQKMAHQLQFFWQLPAHYQPQLPWQLTVLPPEQETLTANAQYTYRRLNQVDQYDLRLSFSWQLMLAGLLRNHRWMQQQQVTLQERQFQHRQDAIYKVLNSEDTRVDTTMVDLYLQELHLQHQLTQLFTKQFQQLMETKTPDIEESGPVDSKEAIADPQNSSTLDNEIEEIQIELTKVRQKLARHLWQLPEFSPNSEIKDISDSSIENSSWFYGNAYQDETSVHFYGLTFANLADELPDFTQYLCDRQFTNIRYRFVDNTQEWTDYE